MYAMYVLGASEEGVVYPGIGDRVGVTHHVGAGKPPTSSERATSALEH